MSPIRNPAQHRSQNSTTGGNGRTGGGGGGGGFALAGIAKNTSTPGSGTASPISGGKDDAAARDPTPKPL